MASGSGWQLAEHSDVSSAALRQSVSMPAELHLVCSSLPDV